ncbi:MmgE/PrpD family protein [Pseudaestuariivita sp.]|uniref:MmgE/PrpD family protein n=1 Tax=Pseudaestuariivita sp. TaxID=2211669 RepID=UPI004059A8C7
MSQLLEFIHNTTYEDLPAQAIADAKRGLLDTLGVAIAGSQTELSRIIRSHAVAHFGAGTGPESPLWLDGRMVSSVGAALANGMTIDALDAHDGSKPTKGHVGCGVVAASLALAQCPCSGQELLTRIVIGYEVGTRAGIALHATACDYHTSGAWIALAAAAIGARTLRLEKSQTLHALGIAEYHGPRSQMMRCIDHPTMVKDGSGWGAMAGVSAAYLAQDGFTGAPSVTATGPDVSHIWSDLGKRWYVGEQYIKLYPVCRWAQPAVEGTLKAINDHGLEPHDIKSIEVETFHEAARLTAIPTTTEEAQYSLPFSVAAAVLAGTIGPSEVSAAWFSQGSVSSLAQRVSTRENEAFNQAFPARRFGDVHVTLKDGRVISSGRIEAQGDPETPLPAKTIEDKFLRLASPVIGTERGEAIRKLVATLDVEREVSGLLDALAAPHHTNLM